MSRNKSRKAVMTLLTVAAIIAGIGASAGIIVPSYLEWKEYYDRAEEEKEYQEYLNSLPLEFLGISAELSDSVSYFDNGKANPQPEDFTVTAHFTEKGKNFDEILMAADYSIDVPDNFALDGGTVTVSYTYTPVVGEEEDPKDPITKTASIEIKLIDVIPSSIRVISDPYRVYYQEGMTFEKEGMEVEIIYNDGSTRILDSSEINVDTTTALTTENQTIKIGYELGDISLSTDLDISVVKEADYDEGSILSIEVTDFDSINEGSIVSDLKLNVRGEFTSGNRIMLNEDQYSVSGNVERATFTKKCIVTVASTENANIVTRFSIKVINGLEAENSSTPELTTKTVDGYNSSFNGDLVSVGNVSGIEVDKEISLTFNLNASTLAKPKLYLRASNRNFTRDENQNYVSNDLYLKDVMKIEINGREVLVPNDLKLSKYKTLSANEFDKYVFETILVPSLVLNNGDNTVTLTFNKDAKLFIDSLYFENGENATYISSSSDLIVNSAMQNQNSEMVASTVVDWNVIEGYAHGLCTDGRYIYMVHTSYSNSLRPVWVSKIDPENSEIIATSQRMEEITTEDYAGISYYDGKVILLKSDGKMLAADVETFSSETVFTDYSGLVFEGSENTLFKDLFYSESRKVYATLSGNSILLFNENFELSNTISVPNDLGNVKRLTADNNYIYVLYSSNGLYEPNINIYDYDGNFVGRTRIPIILGDLNTPYPENSSVQGIVMYGDDLYVTISRWNKNGVNSDGFKLLKLSVPDISDDIEAELNFGEYLNACTDASVEPKLTATPLSGAYGQVETNLSGTIYSMGVVSDGEYVYYAVNGGGNSNATIIKTTISGDFVTKSATFSCNTAGTAGDNARLFIKDGKLYMIGYPDIYSIDLDRFDNNCTLNKDEEIDLSVPYDNPFAAYYNDNKNLTFILSRSKKVYLKNNDGSNKELFTPTYSGMNASSLFGDDNYLYVSYSVNSQGVLPIDVYTYEGVKVRTFTISGINLGKNDEGTANVNYNIQCVNQVDGRLYATVTTWDQGKMQLYVFTINFDKSGL